MKVDNEQAKTINCNESALVVAGPGSGKTRTLVAKSQHLASQEKSHIALTFTRSAAEELRSRSPKAVASTIHSFCYRRVRSMSSYEELLWDFLSLKKKPKFEWVLIDEAQDLTELEWEVCKSICASNFFIVGDPAQHIYKWHEEPFRLGSFSFDAIKQIRSEISPRLFYLHSNYRSLHNIVSRIEGIHQRNLLPRGTRGRISGTAIVFRTNAQLLQVANALEELEIPHNTKTRNKRHPGDFRNSRGNGATKISVPLNVVESRPLPLLATGHCTKGTEFRRVACMDWGERLQEPNLYYTIIARAAEEFRLVNSLTEITDFISEDNK